MKPAKNPRSTAGADDLRRRLGEMFKAPAWVLLPELRNGTGYARNTTRYCDAIAIAPWPSRGLTLCGFEIKISRSDWLAEMKHPEKAEEFARFCDQWWLVVPNAEIVATGELPPAWGLLVAHGDGLRAVVKAPMLTPEPIDRLFLASILRAVSERWLPRSDVDGAMADARAEGEEHGQALQSYAQQELATLAENLHEFESAAGFSLRDGYRWNLGDVGAVVRTLIDDHRKIEAGIKDAEYYERHLEEALETLRKSRATMTEYLERRP